MTYREAYRIYEVMVSKGYKVFLNGEYNLNIIGERSSQRTSNRFDDTLHVLYKSRGNWRVLSFPITTDPGKYWLNNPMNKDGTLIMLPGQYLSAYKLGIHGRGKVWGYQALEQVSPMDFYRDNNGNDILDIPPVRVGRYFRGIFKANIHRASKWKVVQYVERYSAGCQVFQKYEDWQNFMLIVRQAAMIHGDRFSYTLLDEKDFQNG